MEEENLKNLLDDSIEIVVSDKDENGEQFVYFINEDGTTFKTKITPLDFDEED